MLVISVLYQLHAGYEQCIMQTDRLMTVGNYYVGRMEDFDSGAILGPGKKRHGKRGTEVTVTVLDMKISGL